MVDDIRRSQLAGVFGVGSLRIMVGGISMICGSLDLWLHKITKQNKKSSDDKYEDEEWSFDEYRLRQFLDVDYFNYPPQYRKQPYKGGTITNAEIVIPYFLFPRYMYCSNNVGPKESIWTSGGICGRLKRKPQTLDQEALIEGLECDECSAKAPLYQVNMITICDNGHIDDFPWFEWAHSYRDNSTGEYSLKIKENCNKDRLVFRQVVSKGIATQEVICGNDQCKASATLEDCFYNLEKKLPNFLCSGSTPWYGSDKKQECDQIPKAIYRSGSSVYKPVILTSLYVPLNSQNENLVKINDDFMTNQKLKNEKIKLSRRLYRYEDDVDKKNERIRDASEDILEDIYENQIYKVEEIEAVLRSQLFNDSTQLEIIEKDIPKTPEEYKKAEYKTLLKDNSNPLLRTRVQNISKYSPEIKEYINNLVVVDKLVETKALIDFTRSKGEIDLENISDTKLWENSQKKGRRWLPGVQHNGEGIFIEFNKNLIDEHSNKKNVTSRLSLLEDLDEDSPFSNYVPNLDLLFVHTFSHLLINEMTTYAGYNAASIAERLYVNQQNKEDMCGLLIYTAAGDEEGTLGGLSRLVDPEIFNKLFHDVITNSRWCSTDPICNQGDPQGPFNKNLGACHSCALLPETSCEHRNSFLDRGVVVGTQEDRSLGLIQTKNLVI